MTTLTRILARTETSGDCLLWTGATHQKYGQIRDQGRTRYVHRAIYEEYHGFMIPPGLTYGKMEGEGQRMRPTLQSLSNGLTQFRQSVNAP